MPRTGCAFCFFTLDRSDPDADKTPVACGQCSRPYHQSCLTQGCNGRCVVPSCGQTVPHKPCELPPTPPINVYWMACDPHAGGPANTLDDTPVGLSSGMVGDVGGKAVAVKNNSVAPVWVRRLFFGPPWADVQLGPTPEALPDPAAPMNSHHEIQPQETKVLHVRLSPARPVSAEKSLWLEGQELVLCSAPVTGACLFFVLTGLLALLGVHLAVTIDAAATADTGYWWPSVTFGLAVGYTAFFSPGWSRGIGLFTLEKFCGWFDRLMPGSCPVARAYDWLNAPDAGTAGRYFRLLLFAGLIAVITMLLHRALPSWGTVSLMSNATGSVFAFIGVGLLYAFVLLLLWSWWLGKFGLFDWLWNSLSRRVHRFGHAPSVSVPLPVAPRSP